jgi:hypothetical protein
LETGVKDERDGCDGIRLVIRGFCLDEAEVDVLRVLEGVLVERVVFYCCSYSDYSFWISSALEFKSVE